MSHAQQAALSVIVPSVNGWADLEGCLAALSDQGTPLEILVPDRCGEPVRRTVAARFPGVRLLEVPARTGIPQMRAAAVAVATAPTVAIIEDHVLVPPGWAASLLEARAAGAQVVGGTVRNAATGRTRDWAAFLCEYSQLAGPLAAGPAETLPGNNTAYDRALLQRFRGLLEAGAWEDVLHAALRREGVTLWCRPDIIARHKKHFTVTEYLSQRFLYARSYAGMRLKGANLLLRLGYGGLALGLPPLLLARIVTRVWRGRTHRAELLRSLPLIALFVCAWGLGETIGAWFGAGDALGRVK